MNDQTQGLAVGAVPGMAAIEQVLVTGDLAGLTPAQRVSYYKAVCQSLGLNPLTKPFDYISLNSKLVLYPKKDCTDQLRTLRSVSITSVVPQYVDDLYVVTACASVASGRTDSATGAVCISGLKGEAKANALMKAETKAKRRVTLSICGLGMTDDSEVDSVEDMRPVQVDAETGEIISGGAPDLKPPQRKAPEAPAAHPAPAASAMDHDTTLNTPPPVFTLKGAPVSMLALVPVHGSPVINEAQGKRLFAICRGRGLDTDQYRGWLHAATGYASDRGIVVAHYPIIVAAAEAL